MKIRWTRSASDDLEEIEAYLAEKNPIAAIEQILSILDQVEELLPVYPEIGPEGRIASTRERVIVGTKFIAIYQVTGETLDILRILHSARKWPSED